MRSTTLHARSRTPVLLALLVGGAALLSPGGARADEGEGDPAQSVDRFLELLGKKRVEAALKSMTASVDCVAGAPAEAARLAHAVLDDYPKTIKNDRDNSDEVAALALTISTKSMAGAAAPDPAAAAGPDDRARAHVFARLAVAATTITLGDPVKPAQWSEPLADLRKIAAAQPSGEEDVVFCVNAVLDAAEQDIPDDAALRAAAETAAFGKKTFPQSTKLEDLVMKSEIALACALAITKPADAKGPLVKALTTLAALPGIDADKEKLHLWNRCVGEAKRVGGAGKFEFKFETQRSPNGWFEFDWPKESGWTVEEEGSERGVFQITRRGPRSSYILDMTHYRHDTNYFGDAVHSIGGENKAGLAKSDHDGLLPLFTKVGKDDKNAKTKLSNRYTEVNGFDIRGMDKDGAQLRIRGWYFFGKVNKHTMVLTLTQVGAVKEKDPQLEFVLESIREPGGK